MIELTFTIPRAWWMSLNDRPHWAEKARRTRNIRRLAYASSVDLGLEPFGTVHAAAFIGYLTGGRADPANSALVVKAAIDGLVDAGLLPDDDSAHVIGPTYLRDPAEVDALIKRLEELDPSDDYHAGEVTPLNAHAYYAAIDRAVKIVSGELRDWMDLGPNRPIPSAKGDAR